NTSTMNPRRPKHQHRRIIHAHWEECQSEEERWCTTNRIRHWACIMTNQPNKTQLQHRQPSGVCQRTRIQPYRMSQRKGVRLKSRLMLTTLTFCKPNTHHYRHLMRPNRTNTTEQACS